MSRLSYTCRVDGREVSAAVESAGKRTAPVDASDLLTVYDAARKAASASASAPVSCSRIERGAPRHDEDLEWIQRRMTPSCKAYGWDPSQVVSFDKWNCRYIGKGYIVDKDGHKKEVFNPFKSWSGTIASCASMSSESLGIPDATMDAVRRMAHYQADGDASGLSPEQFLCRVESLPRL